MSIKQHAPPARDFALDGREVDLLHYIYGRKDIKEIRNNPQKVLAAIDDYHSQFNVLMNIGPTKGAHIVNLLDERKPSTMVELGSYVGYSAILFAEALSKNGGKQYLGLELNPEMAAVANQLIDLAGLQGIAKVLVGSSDDTLKQLVQDGVIKDIELIFIDHWQERYLPDLWLMEELNLLKPGKSVLVADNIIYPGAPHYLKWVESTTEQKSAMVEAGKAGTLKPNPNLIYESTTTKFETDFGLDAVTVTRVVG
ncbi:hypothetical protein N7468_009514 [Penicillium chermesinum]|uniref:catechol O-methyltransferase n=1 Tax=Penicillium chermesinum TaxID=63820 RepID=A0A9W9TG77_9EURO|nr:uncharacterized protein N7468_009514 [Penicillium chermesinum]KAJ5220310.1 hypothetical protein N7468_009514 [Penicillium chermesinum]KAJ6157753.1 hypothetical protein N7470_005345 [Penicillium chermesinum]